MKTRALGRRDKIFLLGQSLPELAFLWQLLVDARASSRIWKRRSWETKLENQVTFIRLHEDTTWVARRAVSLDQHSLAFQSFLGSQVARCSDRQAEQHVKAV